MTDRKVIQIPIEGLKNGLQVSFTRSALDIQVYEKLLALPGRRGANVLDILKKETGTNGDAELLKFIDTLILGRLRKRPEVVRRILRGHFLVERE